MKILPDNVHKTMSYTLHKHSKTRNIPAKHIIRSHATHAHIHKLHRNRGRLYENGNSFFFFFLELNTPSAKVDAPSTVALSSGCGADDDKGCREIL